MKKRGADQFFSGEDGTAAVLAFRLNGRHLRFRQTDGEYMRPQLEAAYASGKMPPLLTYRREESP